MQFLIVRFELSGVFHLTIAKNLLEFALFSHFLNGFQAKKFLGGFKEIVVGDWVKVEDLWVFIFWEISFWILFLGFKILLESHLKFWNYCWQNVRIEIWRCDVHSEDCFRSTHNWSLTFQTKKNSLICLLNNYIHLIFVFTDNFVFWPNQSIFCLKVSFLNNRTLLVFCLKCFFDNLFFYFVNSDLLSALFMHIVSYTIR